MSELPQINCCGSCTACCTAMDVPSLNKPEGVPCSHLCEKGCGIYSNRPKECIDFNCYWLYNQLPIEYRPDQIGLILGIAESSLGPVLVVNEHLPGAFSEKQGQQLVAQVALDHKAFICLEQKGQPKQILLTPWTAHLEIKARELLKTAEPSEGVEEPPIVEHKEVVKHATAKEVAIRAKRRKIRQKRIIQLKRRAKKRKP